MSDKTIVGEPKTSSSRSLRRRRGRSWKIPCSAGHSACYVSPYGDVYPCVQFPLPSGNVRQQKFIDIWKYSPAAQGSPLDTHARPAGLLDLRRMSAGAARCPGLAYMEGNMRGPSTADCEKSFARTGIPSANMLLRAASQKADS